MYEISTGDAGRFEGEKAARRVYRDGVYVFTFEHAFFIYYCHRAAGADAHEGLPHLFSNAELRRVPFLHAVIVQTSAMIRITYIIDILCTSYQYPHCFLH